ncbi:glycosyltransferase family 4 protein [Longispora albida]|uniref:glycosyltransferase family 4 protein n=1 Tax=Longispora albida TaxID=203523 RepID=UPI0003724717|nr:glycosyltransferase family 4 protein [Longispora albida]
MSTHIVIAVANLPVEKDRRVIRECQSLEAAGYRVSVICPRGPQRPDIVPGTKNARILSYPQPFAGGGLLSFAVEFAWSFLWIALRLTQAVVFQRARAAQVCNPPDVFWPLALVMRALRMPFVFDHHDLSPEVYESRGGSPSSPVHKVLRVLEKLSLRCSTAVISTNESYKQMAVDRGGCRPEKMTVVRNGPYLSEIVARPAMETTVDTIVYLGVLGAQDGVDAAIEAAAELRTMRGGWRMVVAGDGECLESLKKLTAERGLSDLVEFTGWLEAPQVDELLSRATVGLQPDPPSPHAQRSTMAKTIEYLGRGVPVVAVDLVETRRSAGDAAVYVPAGSPAELAGALDELLGDPQRRACMSGLARARFVEELAWDHQGSRYVALWDRLLTRRGSEPVPAPRPPAHDRLAADRARADSS